MKHVCVGMVGLESFVSSVLDLTKAIWNVNKRNFFDVGVIEMEPSVGLRFKIFDVS